MDPGISPKLRHSLLSFSSLTMQPSDWNDVKKPKYGHLSESASQYQEPVDILELASSAFCMGQRGLVLLHYRGNFKKCWFATVF